LKVRRRRIAQYFSAIRSLLYRGGEPLSADSRVAWPTGHSKGKKAHMAHNTRFAAALAFAVLTLPISTPAAFAQSSDAAQTLQGVWLTQAKSEITVSTCPDDFCGNISKIVVPDAIYKANKKEIDSIGATNFTDLMNKDRNLRSRPIMGLQILTLHPNKDKPNIFDGQIYNPQDGNTYSGYVEVLGPDKIRLNGCILYNIICKGEEWTRVPQPETPPADGTTAAAPAASAPAAAAPAATDSGASAGSFQ